MQLKDFPEDDGKKVWLTQGETGALLEHTRDTEQRIALSLAVRCGLRTHEVVEVTPTDLVDGPGGRMIRVWDGKGSKYRETPIPNDLAATINAYADVRPEDVDVPLVPRKTRTLRKWVKQAADRARADTGDDAWRFLSMHDLRRTWGQLLVESDVEPGMVMEWGGWEDWKTFREHYLGLYSAKKQREERGKVEWLQ